MKKESCIKALFAVLMVIVVGFLTGGCVASNPPHTFMALGPGASDIDRQIEKECVAEVNARRAKTGQAQIILKEYSSKSGVDMKALTVGVIPTLAATMGVVALPAMMILGPKAKAHQHDIRVVREEVRQCIISKKKQWKE